MKKLLLFSLLIMLLGCNSDDANMPEMTEEKLTARLAELAERAEADLAKVPIDSTRIPRALYQDGSLKYSTSRDWTSGFYAGTLWQLYRFSKKETLYEAAKQWTAFQEKEKYDTHTHDLGFKIYCSFGEGYAAEQQNAYKNIIVKASETLIKRYNPTVGAIRSWDWNEEVWQFPVIVDNMMNLEMLFAATELTGDSTFYNVAYQHAMTTLEHHFRPDYSSYHVIDYDTLTGAVRNRHTHQGVANESAWARGQAWGLYGFTVAYRETKDTLFLNQAKAIADFFFHHPNLPADKIPYWDFDAENIPNELRDASAATVAASALLESSQYDEEHQAKYIRWADEILTTLATSEYQASVSPFLLQHSVGSIPGDFEVDVPIVYADYYYVEALLRRLAIEQNRVKS